MQETKQATIRERGQLTVPAEIVRELKLRPGDKVDLEVEDGRVVMTPSRKKAIDAIEAIRRAFEESDVTEEELIAEGKRLRSELVREKYGLDAEA